MSYTNTELIRHHLVTAFPTRERTYDQPFVFENDEYLAFFSGAVDEDTLLVKSIQGHQPTRTAVTLSSTTTGISSAPLAPGSVVVASDSSLGTIYVENVDYAVNYAQGELTIKGGGDLSVGQTVTVWYQAYATYTSGSDYQIRADRGEIKRLAGGNIASKETVYLDFSPVFESYNQSVLDNAVAEANGLIEREVDPERQFGADPTLQASATYRALEIVCRAAAARELSSMRGDDRTALAWMKLADTFAAMCEKLLASFRPPLAGPSTPVHS